MSSLSCRFLKFKRPELTEFVSVCLFFLFQKKLFRMQTCFGIIELAHMVLKSPFLFLNELEHVQQTRTDHTSQRKWDWNIYFLKHDRKD